MSERVLVCGDREWTDRDALYAVLDEVRRLVGIDCVIEGEARGADRMGRDWADEQFIPVLPFPADWQRLGKAAGPIRNARMLLEGRPTLVLAFHADLASSKGTRDMVDRALRVGVPVRVWPDQHP